MTVVEGNEKYFLDTNIFVYSFDGGSPAKQSLARQLIQNALTTQQGTISTQIVQEFLNVALRKFTQPMSVSEARDYMQVVLMPLCQHYPSLTSYEHALRIKSETGYSFYDALVVAAALELDCQILWSEDLQHGRSLHGLTILNPFQELAAA
ncbi:MAG: PIN domain-containing protein [Ardenticatenaceae bacterium]|nr:PIN domain-containing protein [Ardenticatenaceae bacterium]